MCKQSLGLHWNGSGTDAYPWQEYEGETCAHRCIEHFKKESGEATHELLKRETPEYPHTINECVNERNNFCCYRCYRLSKRVLLK